MSCFFYYLVKSNIPGIATLKTPLLDCFIIFSICRIPFQSIYLWPFLILLHLLSTRLSVTMFPSPKPSLTSSCVLSLFQSIGAIILLPCYLKLIYLHPISHRLGSWFPIHPFLTVISLYLHELSPSGFLVQLIHITHKPLSPSSLHSDPFRSRSILPGHRQPAFAHSGSLST